MKWNAQKWLQWKCRLVVEKVVKKSLKKIEYPASHLDGQPFLTLVMG